jgi:hypothetical protein
MEDYDRDFQRRLAAHADREYRAMRRLAVLLPLLGVLFFIWIAINAYG